MSQAASIMYEGCIESALDLKEKALWIAFAGITTPWPDDDNPPTPGPGETDVTEPLVYVKAAVKQIVKPVTQGAWEAIPADQRVPLPLNGIYYAYVDDADAYDEYARWIYVRGSLNPAASGHPTGTFRMVRVLSGLTPAAGHEGAEWLLSANVADRGKLRWGDNLSAVTVTTSNLFTVHIPIEFR